MDLAVEGASPGVAPSLEAEYIRAVESTRSAFGTPAEEGAIRAAEAEFAGLGDWLRHEAAAAHRHHR